MEYYDSHNGEGGCYNELVGHLPRAVLYCHAGNTVTVMRADVTSRHGHLTIPQPAQRRIQSTRHIEPRVSCARFGGLGYMLPHRFWNNCWTGKLYSASAGLPQVAWQSPPISDSSFLLDARTVMSAPVDDRILINTNHVTQVIQNKMVRL